MDTTKTEKMFDLVDQWKASGKTQTEFCRDHDIKAGTLGYWVGKKKRADQTTAGFALVDLTNGASGRQVEITYPNGVRLLVGGGDLALIGQLINLY